MLILAIVLCEGIELRKVEERREDERQGHAGEGSGGVGGMFDVQMILEMRRRVLECEEDSDEPGDNDIWEN